MKNPFPGMNPWLEEFWRDVHASLLVYARDQLNAELPPDLHARVDERLSIEADDEKARAYLPDLAITEPWDRPPGPVLGQGGRVVAAAEPVIVDLSQQILRRLEIVDSRAHVITAIEMLSPSNKQEGEALLAWHRKRSDYLRGGINLVEIDLLRGGSWTLPDRSLLKPPLRHYPVAAPEDGRTPLNRYDGGAPGDCKGAKDLRCAPPEVVFPFALSAVMLVRQKEALVFTNRIAQCAERIQNIGP